MKAHVHKLISISNTIDCLAKYQAIVIFDISVKLGNNQYMLHLKLCILTQKSYRIYKDKY